MRTIMDQLDLKEWMASERASPFRVYVFRNSLNPNRVWYGGMFTWKPRYDIDVGMGALYCIRVIPKTSKKVP